MSDPAPKLDYRGPLKAVIQRAERPGEILFYVGPLHPLHDPIFWICFLIGCAFSTLIFSEPLMDALWFREGSALVLGLLLVVSWGICGWLSLRASIAMNPHWRLLVHSSGLFFRSRAAWKSMNGTWDRSQISDVLVDDGGGEAAGHSSFSLRLHDDTEVGLVVTDQADRQGVLDMAADVSRLLDVPVQVRVPSPRRDL